MTCLCWPCCRPTPKKQEAKNPYEPSKSVFVSPKEATDNKTATASHVRFVSTAQISLATALREGPRLPSRESGQAQ